MKIVYLSDSKIPSDGADSVHAISMCNALADEENEVILIAKRSNLTSEIYKYYGVQERIKIILIKSFNIRLLGGLLYGFLVSRKIKKIYGIDIIYSRSIHSSIWTYRNGIRFIFESHCPPQNFLYNFFQNRILKSKNNILIILISNGLKKIYSEIFPNSLNKSLVLHDACNIKNPKPSPKLQSQKKLDVCYIGSFNNGLGTEMIPRIALKLPNYKFHAFGKIKKGSGYSKIDNDENLKYYGSIPHGEIAEKTSHCDVFIAPYQENLPSLNWASPMKIFEYMSFNRPIICSDFPVFREVLNENNSILINSNNENEWIDSIKLLSNKKIRERLASNAYEEFKKNYTWQIRAKKVLSFINGE